MNSEPRSSLFTVVPQADQSIAAAVEGSIGRDAAALAALPSLTNVALGDPYLAQQLADLHRHWELRPSPPSGVIGRIRTRLAWWLLGPELRQANTVHATLVRLLDSLIVQLDQDRGARRRIEEHLAYTRDDR